MTFRQADRMPAGKPKKKLMTTVALAAPIIFLIINLFSGTVIGKEYTHVQ